jgi:shikimate kinase
MKSYKTFVDEGPNDPAIFKAIFLAGGPGSGKSFIVGKTGLPALGFKVVNSDDAFEMAMNKAKLTMDPNTIFSTQGQQIRDKAKKLTALKMQGYITGRLGLVIDGTGKNVTKIQGQIKELRSLGYDVGMIYVNTDLDTAIARNDARPRSLPSTQVVTLWKEVQKNIGSFQSMFGSSFQVIDNSQDADFDKGVMSGYKWASKFAKSNINNPKAKKWIQSYAEEHNLDLEEGTDLSMNRALIIDMILKDVKDKIMKDVMKNDLKLLKDIAKEVKRKVEIDFKHKGNLRIRT